jgi:hypothetical protein
VSPYCAYFGRSLEIHVPCQHNRMHTKKLKKIKLKDHYKALNILKLKPCQIILEKKNSSKHYILHNLTQQVQESEGNKCRLKLLIRDNKLQHKLKQAARFNPTWSKYIFQIHLYLNTSLIFLFIYSRYKSTTIYCYIIKLITA